MLAVFLPGVDRLDQLPHKAEFLFHMDLALLREEAEIAAILATDSAKKVLAAFTQKVRAHSEPLSSEAFKGIMNEIKNETGAKGKDLFHPVRILLTGAHSGPEFDRLVPVIEEGAAAALPTRVLSIRERAERWPA